MATNPQAQIAQADKLAGGASGWFSNKTAKLEDAARLYKSAGDDLFNDKGAYQEAGVVFEKVRTLLLFTGSIVSNSRKPHDLGPQTTS